MTFDTDLYYSMFIEETQEQINTIEDNLLKLENEPDNIEYIHETFRMAHSIKGSSAAMNIETMKQAAHSLENILSKIRDRVLAFDQEILDICFQGVDLLKQLHQYYAEDSANVSKGEEGNIQCKKNVDMFIDKTKDIVKEIKKGQKETIPPIEQINPSQRLLYNTKDRTGDTYRIQIKLADSTQMKSVKAYLIINNLSHIGEVEKVVPPDYADLSDTDFGNNIEIEYKTEIEKEKILTILGTISELEKINITQIASIQNDRQSNLHHMKQEIVDVDASTKKQNKKKIEKTTIRVDTEKIDRQIKLIGEFIIDKESINTLMQSLKQQNKDNQLFHQLVDVIQHMNYIGGELQEMIMSTRMLPLESVFNRFPRMIRDLASTLNKQVQFHIEGQETEIDRGIIEELVDPLTHILRNAIDHGLEDSIERKRAGKEKQGNLYLRAKHKDSHVTIEIEDDGK